MENLTDIQLRKIIRKAQNTCDLNDHFVFNNEQGKIYCRSKYTSTLIGTIVADQEGWIEQSDTEFRD